MLGHVHYRIHGNLRIGLDQAGKRREVSDSSPGTRAGARPTAPRQARGEDWKYGVWARGSRRRRELTASSARAALAWRPSCHSVCRRQSCSDRHGGRKPERWTMGTRGGHGEARSSGAYPHPTSSSFRGCREPPHSPSQMSQSPIRWRNWWE